nr:reverse transcriptase domain-containing protein [Tanacetum cinerariifolium]
MLHLGLTSKIYVNNIMRTFYQSLWTRSAVTSEKRSMLGYTSGKVSGKEEQDKVIKGRARSTDLAKPTRQAQPNPDQARQAPGVILVVEAALTGWTLLMKVILIIGNASVALGESYDDSHSSHSYRDKDRFRHVPKVKVKRHKPTDKDDLTMPWIYKEVDPYIPRIHNFKSSRRTRMPNNVKTYDGTGDPEDHDKIFQAVAQVERWAMPTWCHMFNSTIIGAARQKKYVKDPVEICNIKQKDGETVEDFMKRFKVETGCMKGAPECMWISGFMHRVNNPELKKCLNEHVPKTMEEMMITTTTFIRGEAAAASKKKGHTSWRTHGQSKRQTLEKRKVLAAATYGDLSKLSHLIKEIKHGRDQSKVRKKETPAKDKPAEIYMIQSWQRMTRQKVTQSFKRVREITFPPLATSGGVERPLVIEAEIGGHMIHRISGIKEFQAVPSTTDEMLKFPADGGIVIIRSTILISAECATMITSFEVPKQAGVRHENFKVALHPNFPDQEVAIRGTLSAKERTELCSLLKKNLDIFAWQPSDMTRVPRSVAEHQLNIREGYSPVRQKRRGQAPERAKAIQAEVQKLVEAGIMREVYYHDWLFNPVMVKKDDDSWRINVGRKFARCISSRNSIRDVDTLHGWIVMSSNNEAEYKALIASLRIAAHMGVQNVYVIVDSKLVANQVLGTYVAKEENMIKYLEKEGGKKAPYQASIIRIIRKGSLQAVIPYAVVNVRQTTPSRRLECQHITTSVDVVHNDEELRLNLDLLEKRRKRATIREATAKLKMTKYCNARVRGITFRPGDFVYRSNHASHAVDGRKLGLKWEGPYEVTKALGDGAYKLRSADGMVLPGTWNVANLKKYYL